MVASMEEMWTPALGLERSWYFLIFMWKEVLRCILSQGYVLLKVKTDSLRVGRDSVEPFLPATL